MGADPAPTDTPTGTFEPVSTETIEYPIELHASRDHGVDTRSPLDGLDTFGPLLQSMGLGDLAETMAAAADQTTTDELDESLADLHGKIDRLGQSLDALFAGLLDVPAARRFGLVWTPTAEEPAADG